MKKVEFRGEHTLKTKNVCISFFLYLQLFVGGFVFYLCYLCLLACGGVKNGQTRKLATSMVQKMKKNTKQYVFYTTVLYK